MGHGVQESLLAGGGSDAAQSKAVVMLLQEARATRHYMLYLVAFVIVQTPGFVYRMYQLYDVDGFLTRRIIFASKLAIEFCSRCSR